MSGKGLGAVVGIDLGTTNSLVCVIRDDGLSELVAVDGAVLMPSVVGRGPGGELLVGRAALNLWGASPDRVVRSVKRKMGSDEALSFGDGPGMTPTEVSAAILRRLKLAAEEALGGPVERAVITVPAFFNDAQRAATRTAGEIAGLRVERVLNEPTAAALCYGDEGAEQTWLVYDLGGGTFDVSIVRASKGVTEVLASHGDTHLGGDDFDLALSDHLEAAFRAAHGVGVEGLVPRARLLAAAEAAKIRLSSEPFVRVVEEALVAVGGIPKHLDVEVSRESYEELIAPWLERTRHSVQRALRDAALLARDLDDVLLVGGASRTPRVREILFEMLGREPRMDVDPDCAVALGAGLQAARAAGQHAARILVDVTPYTFGTRVLGYVRGVFGPERFHPIIRRNTPLPARFTEVLYTAVDGQERLDVDVLQGEEEAAADNELVGEFKVEGLDRKASQGSAILFDFRLDLDGILEVKVTERHTGLSKGVRIENATRRLSDLERDAARERMVEALAGYDRGPGEGDAAEGAAVESPAAAVHPTVAEAQRLLPRLARSDSDEVQQLLADVAAAATDAEREAALATLADVLFYLQ